MKVAVAADHRGKDVHKQLIDAIRQDGHVVVDMPTCQDKACDYPDIAYPISIAVAHNEIDRGVLICGTGIGMCIAANKVPGIRAALVHNAFEARMTREHNNANVICFGARVIGEGQALEALETFVKTAFQPGDDGRHQRRVDKITALEAMFVADS